MYAQRAAHFELRNRRQPAAKSRDRRPRSGCRTSSSRLLTGRTATRGMRERRTTVGDEELGCARTEGTVRLHIPMQLRRLHLVPSVHVAPVGRAPVGAAREDAERVRLGAALVRAAAGQDDLLTRARGRQPGAARLGPRAERGIKAARVAAGAAGVGQVQLVARHAAIVGLCARLHGAC